MLCEGVERWLEGERSEERNGELIFVVYLCREATGVFRNGRSEASIARKRVTYASYSFNVSDERDSKHVGKSRCAVSW